MRRLSSRSSHEQLASFECPDIRVGEREPFTVGPIDHLALADMARTVWMVGAVASTRSHDGSETAADGYILWPTRANLLQLGWTQRYDGAGHMPTAGDGSRRRSHPGQVSPDLIPLAQAVAEFGVSRSLFYELMKAGRLHRYRQLGEKRTLVDQREIRRLLRPQKVGWGLNQGAAAVSRH